MIGQVLLLLTVSGSLARVLESQGSLTAVLGKDVLLPCSFRATEEGKVVQVTWLKRADDGQAVELGVLNLDHGMHLQEPYQGRVLRHSQESLEDGSILLKNVVQADEGTYECQLITFPLGNFESSLTLKVLVPPLPTLNLGPPLEEGQGRTLAASCTAEGSPVPIMTWETEVRGTSTSRQSSHPRSSSVTSEFYVVPGRSMHGKALTCVVSHPGLQHQKRITHTLNVAYLSDASILGHESEEDWIAGREGASLKCLCDGNPPPTYNWTRLEEPLPSGVKIKGDALLFQRPLSAQDEGVYICHVANSFASKEVQATVSIKANQAKQVDVVSVSMIGAGLIAVVLLGLLILVVVLMTCYHKRKTKRITKKYEEELTLTRENSIRRLHSSHSTDTRNQTEENLPLRSESRQGSFRGDSLCRESLCRDSRQGSFRADSLRETSLCSIIGDDAEGRSYSTLSTVREIETQTELPPTPPTPIQENQLEKEKAEKEKAEKEKDEEEERDGENNIKQAMTHFVQENGTLRAKPTTNGIYINGRGHLV
ncbi:nectin-4 [Hemicordylus capensis]|uniref:nectin-4 n=1 Tax=Hemicordylus capensis TaxID=884348 RepID=UPI0023027BCF|nr:nectin-4 [Hemicordylus capensis]XP_053134715.1 nectin-4 [Hemicordylus capensis]XP_053134716.1 nectin-4 [Hemicordylus capensis]